jgi:hypothetical protein
MEAVMSDPRFSPHPDIPRTNYQFTDKGWLWKLDMKVDAIGKVILQDAAGLTIQSRNMIVVPNSPAVFKGATSNEANRMVEFLGLSNGITMLDVTDGTKPDAIISLQVEVKPVPNRKVNFVAFDGASVALNSNDTPVPYSLQTTKRITGGPPESLFDAVPAGTKHVAISCHGQMHPTADEARRGIQTRGLELFIAGGITNDNCDAVFSKLNSRAAGGVVWLGGCEAGADLGFCNKAAKASGCFIVASSITLPPIKVPPGQIEFFPGNMIKFFNRTGAGLISKLEFMSKAKDLKFHIVVV